MNRQLYTGNTTRTTAIHLKTRFAFPKLMDFSRSYVLLLARYSPRQCRRKCNSCQRRIASLPLTRFGRIFKVIVKHIFSPCIVDFARLNQTSNNNNEITELRKFNEKNISEPYSCTTTIKEITTIF